MHVSKPSDYKWEIPTEDCNNPNQWEATSLLLLYKCRQEFDLRITQGNSGWNSWNKVKNQNTKNGKMCYGVQDTLADYNEGLYSTLSTNDQNASKTKERLSNQ